MHNPGHITNKGQDIWERFRSERKLIGAEDLLEPSRAHPSPRVKSHKSPAVTVGSRAVFALFHWLAKDRAIRKSLGIDRATMVIESPSFSIDRNQASNPDEVCSTWQLMNDQDLIIVLARPDILHAQGIVRSKDEGPLMRSWTLLALHEIGHFVMHGERLIRLLRNRHHISAPIATADEEGEAWRLAYAIYAAAHDSVVRTQRTQHQGRRIGRGCGLA